MNAIAAARFHDEPALSAETEQCLPQHGPADLKLFAEFALAGEQSAGRSFLQAGPERFRDVMGEPLAANRSGTKHFP
jgi:hypothetical protein